MFRPTPILALALWLAACGGSAPAALSVTVTELDSPAGAPSGEPSLSSGGEAVYLSWLEIGEDGPALRFARGDGSAWGAARTVAAHRSLLVNWADVPAITAGPRGALWAHWLERAPDSAVAYGIRIARSADGGGSWSEPWTPHGDDTPTEHGFVAALALDGAMGFAWLDGRGYADSPDGPMALRFRSTGADGADPQAETVIDARVCDCCQTDAAMTASGPIVVYRDRSEDEIRDVYATRLREGAWTEGAPVHEDGWRIEGCPVNGPAVAASGDRVAVAWFSAAQADSRVNVAFSSDGGARFGGPVRLDDAAPLGRVDVAVLADGSALVVWLEQGEAGEGARLRMKRVLASGVASAGVDLTSTSNDPASGFPRIAWAPDGALLFAWTDASGENPRVRVQRLEIEL